MLLLAGLTPGTRLIRTVLCAFSVLPAAVLAQGFDAIEEIVVTAAPARDRVTPSSLVLDNEALREYQPVATADVFRNLIGVTMRSNSRGESIVRIRGAEERQTLVFLDGAPLATPWDGRADLALIPAGLIRRLEVSRGVVPIEYGANSIAGAVDLATLQPSRGTEFQLEMQRGSLGTRNLNLVAGAGLENNWSLVAGLASIERDAERIADKSSVLFDPSRNRERTNTDLSANTGFISAGYAAPSLQMRASLLRVDVERGVAAVGDLDPALANLRYWRIPDWQLTQATLNGSWDISKTVALRFTGWQQWFEQTIDAYQDYSYTDLSGRERGEDNTVGARLTLSLQFKRSHLRLVTTAQDSSHDNQEFDAVAAAPAALSGGPLLRYRQRLLTVGAEADVRLSDTLTSTFGIGTDRAETPLTGDKPALATLSATGWSSGLRWTPAERWKIAATVGERSRFPTPRELYGAALGKFLPNPALRPERALLADLNVQFTPADRWALDLSLWANRSDATLSQRRVVDNGVSKRQRYNTNGSFSYGVDAAATWYLRDNLRAELSFALQDGEARRDSNGDRPVLLQRPDSQISGALDWQVSKRLDVRAELMYTGKAWDIADDGAVTRLPDASSLNLRAFWTIDVWPNREFQLTASIDNLSDALVLPQLGLPAPGRSYRIGITVNQRT